MKKISIIIYVFLCSFSFSHASVEISEIMYNPEGSDTNREWIEIYNIGNSVEIENWYFLENDTYHGLYPEGFSSLGNGERALIVKDIATAQSELGSGIRYIKSSFSLNNTGEALVIADENKNTIDSYTYSADTGANGDGQSLQYVNQSWQTGSPTPGFVNSASNPPSGSESDTGSSTNSNSSSNNSSSASSNLIKEQKYDEPYYVPSLEVSDVIVAQSDFDINAEVTFVRKGKETRELDGYYYINFGDGNILESDERIDTSYRYRSSGNYMVVFEYYRSKFAFEHDAEPDALLMKTVSVIKHNLEILTVDGFDGVVLKNNTNSLVDISNWKIIWNKHEYSFPRYSYLAAGEKTHILFNILGFSPQPGVWNTLQLLSDAYKPIAVFPKYIKKKNLVSKKKKFPKKNISAVKEKTTSVSEWIDFKTLPNDDKDFFGNSSRSYLDDYLIENPNKLEIDFGESLQLSVVDAGKNKKSAQDNNIYYALGSLILMLGVGRFVKHKSQIEKKEIPEDFGTIEIIE